MDKLKTALLNLDEKTSLNYLSLLNFVNEENSFILDNYIKSKNINISNLYFKISIIDKRDRLTSNETNILKNLKKDYLKYFAIIFNFFLFDVKNEYYLKFLDIVQKNILNNIHFKKDENFKKFLTELSSDIIISDSVVVDKNDED